MRRSTPAGRSVIVLAALAGAAGLGAAGCAPRSVAPAAEAMAPAPACPRDAARSRSGRCACTAGHLAVLGACLPPRAGDPYCGPGAAILGGEDDVRGDEARLGSCAFVACPGKPGAMRDVVTGACVPAATVASLVDCGAGAAPIIEDGRGACVPPSET
ncbi:MAG: hypothetical protein M3O50_03465, partial [Myxococcota bacterium]|nr:hypothetical protein [Myxococcota bacterium]